MAWQGKQYGIVSGRGIGLRAPHSQPMSKLRSFHPPEVILIPIFAGDATQDVKSDAALIWREGIRPLTAQCANQYPHISVDARTVGGIPHIAGTRLSVGQILGRLYTLESVSDVVDFYRGRITVDQVKEALAYAQDFIEAVCEPPEDNG